MGMAIVASCIECGVRPKWRPRHRCSVCAIRHMGVTERVAESRRRAAMVPDALRVKVVPARLWPAGQRWCAGCQSFVDLEDCGKGASQCKACTSAKTHAAMVVKTYDIEVGGYDDLFAKQGGKCAICRARPRKTRLAVDHDHKTNAVRGLLCKNCNKQLLGGAHDNIDILYAAVHYMLTPPAAGEWVAPEARGDRLSVLISPEGSGATLPSKPSRLADPPDPFAKPVVTGALSIAAAGGMSVAELTLIGGSQDENGYYRLYQHRDDFRMPF
jgi:hypothetical protein